MFNHVKWHGGHVLMPWLWMKNVNLCNIKTKKKDNEISYSKFHAWMTFTRLQNQLQINIDGLFSPQGVIHEFHPWLMTWSQRCGGNF